MEAQASGFIVLSCIWLFSTTWTVARQAPLSMEFSRQENWSGLRFPPLGIFLTKEWSLRLLCLLHWQVDSLSLSYVKEQQHRFNSKLRLGCYVYLTKTGWSPMKNWS